MMDRIGWAAVGMFVAFKITVLGSFAFEQVTGRAPSFGLSGLALVQPAHAYQITTRQEHIICRTQDDLRLLSMVRDDRARVFEMLVTGRCSILEKGELVDKLDGNGWFDTYVEVLRAKDGQRWWTHLSIVKDTQQ